MQAHPDLKLFISGSGISNPAINKAIRDTGRSGKVFSTGFALPSTMKTYLEDGTCKQYALWKPKKFGYMATYRCILQKSKKIEKSRGTAVDVPTIGKRTIEDGQHREPRPDAFLHQGSRRLRQGDPDGRPERRDGIGRFDLTGRRIVVTVVPRASAPRQPRSAGSLGASVVAVDATAVGRNKWPRPRPCGSTFATAPRSRRLPRGSGRSTPS